MCDRKSSRRHAGKRESSSRSSESGSRSADGAAPEIPIVIPDGKEAAGLSLYRWLAGRCNRCNLVITAVRRPSSYQRHALTCMAQFVHWREGWATFTGNVSSLLTSLLQLLDVGAAGLLTCLCELCHSLWLSPIPLLEYLGFREFTGNRISWLTIGILRNFNYIFFLREASVCWYLYYLNIQLLFLKSRHVMPKAGLSLVALVMTACKWR